MITLEQALNWVRTNCTSEVLGRLKSRQVAKLLADELAKHKSELMRQFLPSAKRVRVYAMDGLVGGENLNHVGSHMPQQFAQEEIMKIDRTETDELRNGLNCVIACSSWHDMKSAAKLALHRALQTRRR